MSALKIGHHKNAQLTVLLSFIKLRVDRALLLSSWQSMPLTSASPILSLLIFSIVSVNELERPDEETAQGTCSACSNVSLSEKLSLEISITSLT